MSILEQIFNGTYKLTDARAKMSFSLRLKEQTFFEHIEMSMGEEFLDRYRDDLVKIERYRDFAYFRQGFQLGIALMQELGQR